MKKKSLIVLALLFSAFIAWCQPKTEKSEELQKRNGFKSIKLAQHIDSVTGATFSREIKEKDEFPAKVYAVKDDKYNAIGEVQVNSVEVKTYRDLVYEIQVTTDRDPRLMKGMEMALGKATYNVRTKAYHWAADSLSLTFTGTKKNLVLLYRSYPVYKKMYRDRGKKIEKIADDF
jgi:hypothetical protein